MRESIVHRGWPNGLNFIDSIADMRPGFLPYANNMRVLPDGSLVGRLTPGGSKSLVQSDHYDVTWFNNHLVCAGVDWRKVTVDRSSFSSSTVSTINTGLGPYGTTGGGNHVTFAEHNGVLYGLHSWKVGGQDAMSTWNGSTYTEHTPGVDSAPAAGRILGIWEGKMWVADAEDPMKVVWSEPFDATTGFVGATGLWPTANQITLGGSVVAYGEEIVGGVPTPEGLCVFTNHRTILIYDSDTGFNTVVDANGGAISRRSIQVDRDFIYGMNEKGIWRTNGRLALEYISDAIAPYFLRDGQPLDTYEPCAVIYDGSYWVSFTPRSYYVSDVVSGNPNLNKTTIEVSLLTGAIMFHQGTDWYPAAWSSVPADVGEDAHMVFIAANGDGSTNGKSIVSAMSGSSSITRQVMLPYAGQDASRVKRLHEIVAVTSGTWSAFPMTDYEWANDESDLSYYDDISTSGISLSGDGVEEGTQSISTRSRVAGVRGRALGLFLKGSGTAQSVQTPDGGDRLLAPTISSVELRFSQSSRRKRSV